MSTSVPRSISFWHETAAAPVYPPLRDSVTADVCVIGAGIAGLSTAYMLSKAGMSVAILEALDLGAGETSRSTAHIAVPDDRYWVIEKDHGEAAARTIADSFAGAIDLIESIVEEAGIECDFERLDGYLFSCEDDPVAALIRERDAARRAGVDVELLSSSPGDQRNFGPCLRFPRQAQFNPFKYLIGLAQVLPRGCSLYTGTRALAVDETEEGVMVKIDGGLVTARKAVVATNTPFNERFGLHLVQSAFQTYVVAAPIRKGLPRMLLWDDADPYHYVRFAPYDDEYDVLIVGGEDHKTGQESDPAEHFDRLEKWMARHFHDVEPVRWRWSGEIMEPLDAIANLGREPRSEHVFLITGDSGNGITHATVGARIVSDLILERDSLWSGVYDPSRPQASHALEFTKEQANIATQYADWLTAGDVDDVSHIAREAGAVIRRGLRKIAVYRDGNGDLFASSATCPHMGCVVQWNNAEKTWDCPCHGSRFTAHGALLHGPADRRLRSMNSPDQLEDLLADAEETAKPGDERNRAATRDDDRPVPKM